MIRITSSPSSMLKQSSSSPIRRFHIIAALLFLNGLAWLAGSPACATCTGGPCGSTYDFELLTGDHASGPYTLHHNSTEPGSFTLHFDGVPESLPSYCCGLPTTPRVTESFTVNGDGTSTVEIIATSPNGSDLYPSGLLGNGNVPQTDGALRIGYYSGSIPLAWNPPHSVLSATVDMLSNGTSVVVGPLSVAPATFFGAPGVWGGNLAVVIPNLVGRGVNRVDLRIVVPSPNDGACVADATTLCLSSGRFKIQVAWQALHLGTSGTGHAVPLTPDTGYFWFFGSSNVELIIKVLDGTPVNGDFWVFYGALSNVQYTITVTDTKTGRSKSYFNPQDTMASVADTSAFSASSTAPIAAGAISVPAPSAEELLASAAPPIEVVATAPLASDCTADSTTLCLSSGRFKVQVAWQALHLGTSGVGHAVPLTSDTGHFWFFGSSNVELVVKVLDGTSVNGDFWVFYGALSNVQYTITVTDTKTGRSKAYFNRQDTMASVADTSAFPTTAPGPLAFDAPMVLGDAQVGVPYFFSFCAPTPTGLDCGTFPPTTNPAGGNPPYHFQLGPNVGFPPFGISLSLNGILSGTPSIQGRREFSVCAFDLSEQSICHNVFLNVTSCTYSLNRPSQSFGASGGINSVTVTAGSDCIWTAQSNESWITVVSGNNGSANGTVNYSVAANPGTSQRTGTMTIAGLAFAVIQAGNTVSGYTYANWNCNHVSGCITVTGYNVGSAGPFCSVAACKAWSTFVYTCDAQPMYPIYYGPPSGTCAN